MKFLMSILMNVLDIFFPPRDTQLIVRTLDENALKNISNPKVIAIEGTQILTLLPYHNPIVQACIIEAKFHNNGNAQKMLGELLLNTIRNKKAILIPIPLGKARKRERGYNQVEKILLESGLPYDLRVLYRNQDSVPQTTLGREQRLRNLKDVFQTRGVINSDSIYVLIDDVVTTGATLLSAHEALMESGAKEVLLLALAH